MADEQRVHLTPMTAEEYAAWADGSVGGFAEDLSRATGRPREAALLQARAIFDDVLPDGLGSADVWLLTLRDASGAAVGSLWLGLHPHQKGAAYVWDIRVDERLRGRGLGRAAMLAAEDFARQHGLSEIGLSVFGFNDGARRLYERIGYRVVTSEMLKTLDPAATGS